MAVKIRLTRVGATKRPSYRVVAIDSRRPRDGRALEILGFYDPLTDPATVQLDGDRLNAWIGKGAKPSETVVKLMRQAGMGGEMVPARPTTGSAPKRRTKKAAAAEAPAEAPTTAAEVAEAPAAAPEGEAVPEAPEAEAATE